MPTRRADQRGATAFGYWGGVLSLFVMLLFFAENESGRTLIGLEPALGLDGAAREGTRFVGPFIAIWFAVFSIPFFLWVRDPPARRARKRSGSCSGISSRACAAFWPKPRGSFLLSSMFYRDALAALYAYGGIYATLVLDWTVTRYRGVRNHRAVAAAVCHGSGGSPTSASDPSR